MVPELNICIEKMYDFVSGLFSVFTIVIKLRNFFFFPDNGSVASRRIKAEKKLFQVVFILAFSVLSNYGYN